MSLMLLRRPVSSVAQTAMNYGGLVESTGSSHSINVLLPPDCVKIDGLVERTVKIAKRINLFGMVTRQEQCRVFLVMRNVP